MEEQSLIQDKSSKNSLVLTKKKVINSIKDNMNYIYIVLMIIVNVLIGLITIEDGSIGLNYPHSLLGWCLWTIRIIIQTAIGVMILGAFRKQGIKLGHETIIETYKAYLKAITKDENKVPRSLKQYLRHYGKRDSFIKSIFYMVSGFAIESVVIGANLNNLLSLVVTTISAIAFGIDAMINAEDFVETELVIWYQKRTAEVTGQKITEPAKENELCQITTIVEQQTLKETCQDKSSSTEERT